MSRFVLDSSVALKWFLPELDVAQAIALRDGFLKGIHEFLAPDIFPVEAAHALAKAERPVRLRSHRMLASASTIASLWHLRSVRAARW
jgi:predicted nucleic acid-binding protein